jgi:hypothetical protein
MGKQKHVGETKTKRNEHTPEQKHKRQGMPAGPPAKVPPPASADPTPAQSQPAPPPEPQPPNPQTEASQDPKSESEESD